MALMARTTGYTVRAYTEDDGNITPEDPTQFSSAGAAQAHAQMLSQQKAGVIVWARNGDADTNEWEEPRIVFRAGRYGDE
jgi:hypothetical protein